MKRLILTAILCANLHALDNGVVIHEAAGSSLTAAPVTLHRPFGRGEFPAGSFPRPRIGGTAATVWQVDVKNRWPDGSIQLAFVSFRLSAAANSSTSVDFVRETSPCHLGSEAACTAAGLAQQAMLDFNAGGGTGSWSATVQGTVNSINYSAQARAMVSAGAWRYWLRGPVVTSVIAEDRSSSLAFDFGWRYLTGVWAAPTADNFRSLHPVFELRFYPDPDGAGALTAWPGVEFDAQLWNSSTTRLQRLPVDSLVVKSGASEAVTSYTASNISFYARRRFHWRGWSGTAPGSTVVDHNFPYLMYTRLIPSYDLGLPVTPALADADLSAYNGRIGSTDPQFCLDTSFCANWTKGIGGTGARGDIALIPRWYLHYLYAMGTPGFTTAKRKEIWDKLLIGNANAAGSMPYHYFETDTKTFFGTTPGFGRTISIDGRPDLWAYHDWEAWNGASGIYPACTSSPCDARFDQGDRGGWPSGGVTNFQSHQPSVYGIPYLLTGYHYYLTGAQMYAAFTLASMDTGLGGQYNRRKAKGIIYPDVVIRGHAWAMRDIFLAAMLTPDGDIEKDYFTDKLRNNAAHVEGIMFLTNAANTPADTSCPGQNYSTNVNANLWCVGRHQWWTFGGTTPPSNPLAVSSFGSQRTSSTDGWTNGARGITGFWQNYTAVSWSWIAGSGAISDIDGRPVFWHVRNAQAAHFAGRVLAQGSNPNWLRDIEWAAGTSYSSGVCTTFADCAAGWAQTYTLDASMNSTQTTFVFTSADWRSNNNYDWHNLSWFKIGNEFIRTCGVALNSPVSGKTTITICAGSRGSWGSLAVAHTPGEPVVWIPGPWRTFSQDYQGGYGVLARAALATLADAAQTGQHNPGTAYTSYVAAHTDQTYASNPQWAFVPAATVDRVRVTRASNSVRLDYVAPSGAKCRVYVGTAAPATSNDSGDPEDTAKSREHSFLATGLSPSTTYNYRIGCGAARQMGQVTTLP